MVARWLCWGVLLLTGCGVSETDALGTYCCERPGEKDCLTLRSGGVYTQVYQVHDSTYTHTGTWSLSERGSRIDLNNYHPRTLEKFKPLGTGVTNANMPFDGREITMMEDRPEYNYRKVP